MLQHRSSTCLRLSRVVVLGATGFIGQTLVRLLQESGTPCRPLGSAEVDLVDSSAAEKLKQMLQSSDSVVVLSALTPEKGRDRRTFLKNVAMIDSICTALTESGCSHVVYIGSDSVYAAKCGEIDEESCCESGDLYALSHIVREKLLSHACQTANVELAIIRPTAIYGAGDTHNGYGPNRFIRTALREGKITLLGEGEEERDHLFIDDLCL
jgi:UDP-glucose 4-epimerase